MSRNIFGVYDGSIEVEFFKMWCNHIVKSMAEYNIYHVITISLVRLCMSRHIPSYTKGFLVFFSFFLSQSERSVGDK